MIFNFNFLEYEYDILMYLLMIVVKIRICKFCMMMMCVLFGEEVKVSER